MKTVVVSTAVCLLAISAAAKDKKQVLPDAVLKAQTIAVVIDPDAGAPLTNPRANDDARTMVEEALRKWGRYRVLAFPEDADLIVSVRRSTSTVTPTISRGPLDRPTTIDPGTRSGDTMSTTIGISRGAPPPLTQAPQIPAGAPRTEVGPAEDTFKLYLGMHQGHLNDGAPLDAPVLWRYSGRNALLSPGVQAVKEFQKAVEQSEKAQKP